MKLRIALGFFFVAAALFDLYLVADAAINGTPDLWR